MKYLIPIISLVVLTIYAYSGTSETIEIKAKDTPKSVDTQVKVDPRKEKLYNFFAHYNALVGINIDEFIETADRYNLDYRLLPAIAGSESTFGRYTPSCADFNPFGWTSTTSPCHFWRFKSFSEAIGFVGEKISTNPSYSKYQKTGRIEDLAISYNPGGTEEWTKKVTGFMREIEDY